MNQSTKAETVRRIVGKYMAANTASAGWVRLDRSPVDSERVRKWRRQVANDFRRQLTLGVPIGGGRADLADAPAAVGRGQGVREAPPAASAPCELYLAYRPTDTSNPVMGHHGSSTPRSAAFPETASWMRSSGTTMTISVMPRGSMNAGMTDSGDHHRPHGRFGCVLGVRERAALTRST